MSCQVAYLLWMSSESALKLRSLLSSLGFYLASSSIILISPMEQNLQNELQICTNCAKLVPAANFETHVGYCLRRVKRCEECGQPIDIADLAKHKTTHQECDNRCTNNAAPKNHKTMCPMRIVECGYCQMQLPKKDLEEHQKGCTLRTIICHVCKLAVVQKNYDTHLVRCKQNLEEVRKSLKRLSEREPDQKRAAIQEQEVRDASIDRNCIKKPKGTLEVTGKRSVGMVARANSPRTTPKPPLPADEPFPYNKFQYTSPKTSTDNLPGQPSILPVSILADMSKLHCCFFPGVKPVSEQ